MKILIVENNARVRRTIRNLVDGVASEVVECADGGEAFSAYQTHNPDLVLMDIGLKDVDGIAVTNHIKAVFPDAQVVIVTDYNDPDLRRAAKQAGACAYVLKETLYELRVVISLTAAKLNENSTDNLVSKTSLTGPDRSED